METVLVVLWPVPGVLAYEIDDAFGTTTLKFSDAFWIGISVRDISTASSVQFIGNLQLLVLTESRTR
jgi:hypothetical protein